MEAATSGLANAGSNAPFASKRVAKAWPAVMPVSSNRPSSCASHRVAGDAFHRPSERRVARMPKDSSIAPSALTPTTPQPDASAVVTRYAPEAIRAMRLSALNSRAQGPVRMPPEPNDASSAPAGIQAQNHERFVPGTRNDDAPVRIHEHRVRLVAVSVELGVQLEDSRRFRSPCRAGPRHRAGIRRDCLARIGFFQPFGRQRRPCRPPAARYRRLRRPK